MRSCRASCLRRPTPDHDVLDRSPAGEEILITRHGKAIARLVPATPTFDRAKARQAARGLLEASRGVTLGGRLKIEDLINEGRP